MISYPAEAVQAILKSLKPNSTLKVSVNDACNFVLARDIKAPMHSPPFDNSAMDGYAFRFNDWRSDGSFEIDGESSAGKPYTHRLKRNQAVRIYTGAAIPPGADTVVMQEKTVAAQDKLRIFDDVLKKGGNIRRVGSEIRKGKTALAKGTYLTPAAGSFLSSLGVTEVVVYPKPSVAIIVTGNELVKSGVALMPGQIYESNSVALHQALQKEGITNISVTKVRDNPSALSRAFEKAIPKHEVVLFTGGISVGDYDFTESTFSKHRVKKIFYKLKQKPGKPIYFGTIRGKAVFGLPGNPASVMTCFYCYVIPALRTLQSHPQRELSCLQLKLSHAYTRKPGMVAFLKAHTDFKFVQILDGQESYIMQSFAQANALVKLEASAANLDKGTPVEVMLLP